MYWLDDIPDSERTKATTEQVKNSLEKILSIDKNDEYLIIDKIHVEPASSYFVLKDSQTDHVEAEIQIDTIGYREYLNTMINFKEMVETRSIFLPKEELRSVEHIRNDNHIFGSDELNKFLENNINRIIDKIQEQDKTRESR